MSQWNGENDFDLFRSELPIERRALWREFYELHKDKISVQNEKVAIDKLKTIINATFKLSIKKGFSLMSLRDLSQETKISMGSLYAYIGSKGQLAEMIHQFLPYMFVRCISQRIKENDPVHLQLTKIIRGHIFLTECLQSWFFFAFMETKHLTRSTKKLAKESEIKSERLLDEVIVKGISENIYKANTVFLSCMMIKNFLQSWYVKHAKYQDRKVHCESYIEFIEKVINQHLESKQ